MAAAPPALRQPPPPPAYPPVEVSESPAPAPVAAAPVAPVVIAPVESAPPAREPQPLPREAEQPEPVEVEAEDAAALSPAVAKVHGNKYDVLRERLAPDISALDFDGLFVRNLIEQNIMNRRVIRFLPRKMLNDLMMQANAQVRDQKYDQAEELFLALSEAEPENTDYEYLYGRVLMLKGKHEEGLKVLRDLRDRDHEMAAKVLSRIEAHFGANGVYPSGAELLHYTGGNM
jgi:predicted Zn-dependent protease